MQCHAAKGHCLALGLGLALAVASEVLKLAESASPTVTRRAAVKRLLKHGVVAAINLMATVIFVLWCVCQISSGISSWWELCYVR
jgi:hypothetical protein